MTTSTVKETMKLRLTRGTPVIVADSFDKPIFRGESMLVASKNVVTCKGGRRCAGDWCTGLAIFVTEPADFHTDKEMGWRSGTTKICLTHLKDADGDLLVPPTLRAQGLVTGDDRNQTVTWVKLAHAISSGDLKGVAFMARALKMENDELKSKVIAVQDRLIEHLVG